MKEADRGINYGIAIYMDYMKDLSVNHYLGRNRVGQYFVKRHVRQWMEELGWEVKFYHLEDWKLPLQVECSGTFRDRRSTPDLSNLSKVTLDAIEEATGINDQNMRWHDGTITIDKTVNPYLTIIIKEAKD